MNSQFDKKYLEDIASAMRMVYATEIGLAACEPTHIMFGDKGVYQRIEEVVEELSQRYEKQQNKFYKTLESVGKIAHSFGIPALSGTIVGAYFGYSEGNLETTLQGAKIGTIYGTLAGIIINCLIETLKLSMDKLATLNINLAQSMKEKDPTNLMVIEVAETTKALQAAVKYLGNIEDYELRAKENILKIIKHPETQHRNLPITIIQLGIKPIMYYISGSIINLLYPPSDYDKLKYASMGLVHVGLEETVSRIKDWVKIRTNKKLVGIISEFSEEERLLLVGSLVNRWFGSSYA